MKNDLLWYTVALPFISFAGATACSEMLAHKRGTGSSIAAAGKIEILEQSNVCVSAHVDQRVWPVPLQPEDDRNVSGFLASELRQHYEAGGGSYHLPGERQLPRFITDPKETDPACKDAEDIRIAASYSPDENGRPFIFSYRIVQGEKVRSGSFRRDIEEEWRTGSLRRFYKTLPLAEAVNQDLRARAYAIYLQLHHRGRPPETPAEASPAPG